MRSVSIREARQQFSDLVVAAEHGQSVLITRHGKQVAHLGPPAPVAGQPLPDLTAFRRTLRIKGKPLSQTVTGARDGARY